MDLQYHHKICDFIVVNNLVAITKKVCTVLMEGKQGKYLLDTEGIFVQDGTEGFVQDKPSPVSTKHKTSY